MTLLPAGASHHTDAPAYPDLDAKRVVVTGASLGVGERLVRAFAANGSRLVLQLDQDRNGLLAFAGELAADSKGLRVFECTFSAEDGIERFAKAAIGAFGGIDVLVNNLGPFPQDLSSARSEADFAGVVAASLRTAEVVTRAVVRRLELTRGPAVIVNVLSLDGEGLAARQALYAMARTTLETLTRADAEEWGELGLRVNSIVVSAEGARDPFADAAELAAPVAGDGLVDEVAAAVLSLASARSRWMNGMTLTVTGMPG